jgi:carboxymethylenebutenolidase
MSDNPKSPGALFDIHTHAEFVLRDVDATMATMSDRPLINNVPTMTGGLGHEAVRQFYDSWFVGHLPDDWTVELLSRTESKDQVVDEVVASFTHDCPMECFLPGVPPTGRKVTIPSFGLLDKDTLPVTGAEQAARLLDPSLPSNTLIPTD